MKREHQNRAVNYGLRSIGATMRHHLLLTLGVALAIAGAVITGLLPPLILEKAVNLLSAGEMFPFSLALAYFGLLFVAGLLESCKQALLTVFGQKITRELRHELCQKLTLLPAGVLSMQDAGAVSSRFVSDVDTVENLFDDGVVSMIADLVQVVSIFVILFSRNRGLSLLLLVVLPLVFWYTRHVQKRTLRAQVDNRRALANVTGLIPETIRNIRTIHNSGSASWMRTRYGRYVGDSYRAIEQTNFFDAIYSPIILLTNAVVVGIVMLLSASGNPEIQSFFGMQVGTAVAVISYISQIFTPLENIGMEIQTIQSALAGLTRINEFLGQEETWKKVPGTGRAALSATDVPAVAVQDVTFGYTSEETVLRDFSLTVRPGETVTLTGRTGAGKSTLFRLLLGLYRPDAGQIRIFGQEAAGIPDSEKRALFGYVEQNFRMVPGTVLDQITLFDDGITREMAEEAAKTAELDAVIRQLPKGYDTPCREGLFSQGQWQLLSIARAIAASPRILLLDEITANLDAATEETVLKAIKNAAGGRTVLSISHRLSASLGGRQIALAPEAGESS